MPLSFLPKLTEMYDQNPGKAGLALLSFCHERGLLSYAPQSLWEKEKKMALTEGLLHTEHLPDPIIELGVFQGGGTFFLANLLAAFHSERTIIAADSFEGLPAPVEQDKVPSQKNAIHYVQGMFKETSAELLQFQLNIANHAKRVTLHK